MVTMLYDPKIEYKILGESLGLEKPIDIKSLLWAYHFCWKEDVTPYFARINYKKGKYLTDSEFTVSYFQKSPTDKKGFHNAHAVNYQIAEFIALETFTHNHLNEAYVLAFDSDTFLRFTARFIELRNTFSIDGWASVQVFELPSTVKVPHPQTKIIDSPNTKNDQRN